MATSPFKLRGVIEGFYGVYYTFPQRADLLRFSGQHGFNLYIYGPKNDRQHRNRWREPYPPEVMAQFAALVEVAREAGVTFCYSLSPGVSIEYSSPGEFDLITAKLRAFYDLGVRAFSLLLDDIAAAFSHPADAARYGSYAEAHVDLCNRTLEWLTALDAGATLSMCPTDYHGRAPFSAYLHALGAGLDPSIAVFYTGPEVCSAAITAAHAGAFAAAVGRPPLIWDNYPVNDLTMQPELHIGPARGRAPDLAQAVAGLVANTMIQPEASKVALLTYADYFANPASYDPAAAWEAALRALAGEPGERALRLVAENSLRSSLLPDAAEPLDRLASDALAALRGGERPSDSPAVAALANYLAALDEAIYWLRNRLGNLALRADLLPWLEVLELWTWLGQRALDVLRAAERGEPAARPLRLMAEARAAVLAHPKRTAGEALLDLASFALEPAGKVDSP